MNIKRINELARKAKTVGLTAEEADEQQRLRTEYLAAFRKGVKQKLDSIILVDEKGNQRSLRKDH
ncbi:MAG: DUF896 domain-containing protein [Ruminiclostridium sp.]|nr:DUF896 domain-containing protein [Ruminiclostridium sp.]